MGAEPDGHHDLRRRLGDVGGRGALSVLAARLGCLTAPPVCAAAGARRTARAIRVKLLVTAIVAVASLGGTATIRQVAPARQAGAARGASPARRARSLARNFDFEGGASESGVPMHWGGAGEGYRREVDTRQAHGGKRSGRISSTGAPPPQGFATLTQSIPPGTLRGKRVRYSGYVKARGVKGGGAALWLRVDGAGGAPLSFDNMGVGGPPPDRGVHGTTNWKRCDIVLDVPREAVGIAFGFLLAGQGSAWVDDLRLEVVGAAGKGPPATDLPVPGARGLADPGIAYARGGYEFTAWKSVPQPRVAFPIPLALENQVPLCFELTVRPPQALKRCVYRQRLPHDWIAEVTFAPLKPGQRITMEWRSEVLIRDRASGALPGMAPLPARARIPAAAARWLKATRSVQASHPEIRAKAWELGASRDLIRLARRIAGVPRTLRAAGFRSTDAVETLRKGGVCTSFANLAAALFRASGVPARILACYPTDGSPLQTHFIVEFYLPGRGWTWLESTSGELPLAPFREVIVAVVYPEDEERSFEQPRWGGLGVPYLSLTENLGSHDVMTAGTIDRRRYCDHVAGPVCALPGSRAKWDRTFAEALAVWGECLKRMQHGAPLAAGLRGAQRRAANAQTLDQLLAHLKRAGRSMDGKGAP